MLTHLTIQHFVLIDKLDLSFDKGLSVFTGETGAGKSILLDALSLVLGARGEVRFVRKGEKQAIVSATFHLSKTHPVHEMLAEQGLESDEDLILRRTLSADGKSKAFVNDQPVGLALLKSVGELLVEIHGQFATHGLLNPATHRLTLDNYGNLGKETKSVQNAWNVWQKRKKERLELEENLTRQAGDESYLQECVDELNKLHPKVGEEEFLTKRRTTLMNAEKLGENLKNIQSLTDEEERGIIALTGRLRFYLEQAERLDESEMTPLLEQADLAENALQEISGKVERLLADMGDENELNQIDDRLFALRDVARKHHVNLDELPDLEQKLQKQLNQIVHAEDEKAQLMRAEEEARLTYFEEAKKLTLARQKAAQKLEKGVLAELPDLKLEKARFATNIAEAEPSENGLDQVTFMIATNKGTDLMPLHKCASGGELARIMLALKVNLNEGGQTLVFDEIDSGISGATASAVGERLARLGENHQTLVITHSPQVAGCGKHHYRVSKEDGEKATVTSVQKLTSTERVEEIARLLSGAHITEAARAGAKELLKN
ncbi:MAG: DNA repair protein RecN [Alphaproteobacteria bacterium]|nr:DNA repair protein RecN [Alphaproteobacteria bacterium]